MAVHMAIAQISVEQYSGPSPIQQSFHVLDPTWTNSSCRSCWNFFGSVVMDTGPISARLEVHIVKDPKQRLLK